MSYDCSPILTEKIIDRISLKNTQKSYMDKVTFTLNKFYDNCDLLDDICITNSTVHYDYIGLRKCHENQTILNSICYSLDEKNIYTKYNGQLYKECSKSNIFNDNNCCYSNKLIIIEKNLVFFICGLKIYIEGTIGYKKFKAFKDFNKKNDKFNCESCCVEAPPCPMSIKKIGFSPITFVGNLALPKHIKRFNLYEDFNSCLSVDYIFPKQSKCKKNQYQHQHSDIDLVCRQRNKLCLSIAFSLTTTKNIYITNTEVQNVLTCSNY